MEREDSDLVREYWRVWGGKTRVWEGRLEMWRGGLEVWVCTRL